MIEVIVCPLCRAEIHRHTAGPVTTKVRIPSSTTAAHIGDVMAALAESAERERLEELAAVQMACVDHYQERHRLRISLWGWLGWNWLMTWPRRRPKPLPPQCRSIGPLEFVDRDDSR